MEGGDGREWSGRGREAAEAPVDHGMELCRALNPQPPDMSDSRDSEGLPAVAY